jgi:hypothetical protein
MGRFLSHQKCSVMIDVVCAYLSTFAEPFWEHPNVVQAPMFVHAKKSGPYHYLHVVGNRREGAKVVQRVISMLG